MAKIFSRRYWNDCVGFTATLVAVYGQKAGNACMRVLGPLLFLACQIAIFVILYFYFLHILPYFTQTAGYSSVLHCLLAVFLGFNIIFNHWACACTPAGSPPVDVHRDAAEVFGDRIVNINGKRVRQLRTAVNIAPGVSYRFCKKCKNVKPPRAHHDSVTGKCVYEMDHFCPWMNNVVGYNNYRYFLMFLLYLLLGCIYCIYLSCGRFLDLRNSGRRMKFSYDSPLNLDSAMIFVFTITLSGLISVSILLGWHIYLTLTNQTTIEFYINAADRLEARGTGEVFKNPYDLGWRKNIRRVFGDSPWYLATLPSVREPPDPMYPFEFSFELCQYSGSSNI